MPNNDPSQVAMIIIATAICVALLVTIYLVTPPG